MNQIIDKIEGMHLWSKTFLNNSIGEYALAFLIFLGFLVLSQIIEFFLINRLKKLSKSTDNNFDNALVKSVDSISFSFYALLGFYISFQFLDIGFWFSQVLDVGLIILIVFQTGKCLQFFVDYIEARLVEKTDEAQAGSTKMAIQILGKLAKASIWVIAFLVALSNLGVNVTSLLAGLGVGGVAVALAAQNILGDLFNSFVIYFDQPFVVGDLIQVGDEVGQVKKIGIKTTRIESLRGEELVFSNSDLTSREIHNFGKMGKRRGKISFGVNYNTPQESLEQVPDMVEAISEDIDDIELVRAAFDGFGDSAIKFEVVFEVDGADYNFYSEKNQEVAFKIKRKLEENDINMPFPTRTVHLKNKDN